MGTTPGHDMSSSLELPTNGEHGIQWERWMHVLDVWSRLPYLVKIRRMELKQIQMLQILLIKNQLWDLVEAIWQKDRALTSNSWKNNMQNHGIHLAKLNLRAHLKWWYPCHDGENNVLNETKSSSPKKMSSLVNSKSSATAVAKMMSSSNTMRLLKYFSWYKEGHSIICGPWWVARNAYGNARYCIPDLVNSLCQGLEWLNQSKQILELPWNLKNKGVQ